MTGQSGAQARIQFVLETKGAEKLRRLFKGKNLGLDDASNSLKKLQKNAHLSSGSIKQLEKSAKALEKTDPFKKFGTGRTKNLKMSLDQQSTALEDLDEKALQSKRGWKGFMGAFQAGFLSMMFAGMQMQKIFTDMFKGLISNYKELAAESDPVRIALTNLEGSFKNLKFQMISAAGPFLIKIADFFARLATIISKADPKKLSAAVKAIIGLAALGGLLMFVGQFGLFVTGMGNLIMNLSKANAEKAVTNSGKLGTNLNKLKGLGAIILSVKFAFEAFNALEAGKLQEGLIGLLASAAAGIAALRFIKGKKGGVMFLVLSILLEQTAQSNLGSFLSSTIGTAMALFGALMMAAIATALNNIRSTFSIFGIEILGPQQDIDKVFKDQFAASRELYAGIGDNLDKFLDETAPKLETNKEKFARLNVKMEENGIVFENLMSTESIYAGDEGLLDSLKRRTDAFNDLAEAARSANNTISGELNFTPSNMSVNTTQIK